MNLSGIGKLISERRKLKGYTQEELGEKLGIGGSSVSKWERGITAPDISVLHQLSQELDINIEELLSGDLNNETKHFIKRPNRLSLIILFFVLIVLFILSFFLFFKKEKVFLINSNNDYVSFSGHLMIGNNTSALTINDFKLINKNENPQIVYYKLELCDDNNTLVEYNYDNFNDLETSYLSKAIEKSFIELIDNNLDDSKLDTLKLSLEYIDINEKVNKTDLSFVIETQ